MVIADGRGRPNYCREVWIVFIAAVMIRPDNGIITKAFQVDLLDSTSSDSLDWISYSTDERSSRRGWREASYTNADGDVLRVYTVCDVAATSVDNWLRTPYLRRGDASRIYVEVKFSMRKCTKYPSPGRLQQCKEAIKLLYYEAESDFANAMMPTWDEETYRHVDVIAADRVFVDNSDAVVNVETRSVAVARTGVYFAFYDRGACATLLSVRIYYVICPAVAANFALFPNTTAGPELTSIVQVDGRCVDNAVIDQMPSYLCKADGSWYYMTGRCQCMPGFEPGEDDGREKTCQACPFHEYKWQTGNVRCLACPADSRTTERGSVECSCDEGYFRSDTDTKAMPCTRPPSAVRNLSAIFVSHSSIDLSWEPPAHRGGRIEVRYRVECFGCGVQVSYVPARIGINTTRVSVTGLTSNTHYRIVVFAENDVSAASGVYSASDIVLTTETAVPPKVVNVRITSLGTDDISLSWDIPDQPGILIESYEVQSWRDSSQPPLNTTSVFVQFANVTFFHLVQQTKYSFMVRGRTEKVWGEFSDVIYATTAHISHLHGDSPVAIVAGSAVGVLICLTVVIVMVALFVRRHRSETRRKSTDTKTNTVTIPLFSVLPGTLRTYVDPHTYEDPHQAVREFTKEIDVSFITIEAVVGGGEFGDVCKGRLRRQSTQKTVDELFVAIKTLKPGASDKNRLDFLTEASIMGQFDDPNVICLEGVVTRSNPIMIVTEFMENGSLDVFLRNNDGMLTALQLTGMTRGIASGMRYLSEMGYVHRDLAARNILVNVQLVCKVSDFGLSREMENYENHGAYTMKGGKIPVRWTAPEAISYHKFTSASDVWSFGVVVWEVMSFGERPYWNWSNREVISAIDRDFRLPPPMDCPENIYELMFDCWQTERSMRPKFSEIVPTLDRLIRTPKLLSQMAIHRQNDFLDNIHIRPSSVDLDESVDDWLLNIKMDRYMDDFHAAGWTSLDVVARICLKDLLEMGIHLVGHQKKILEAVQLLRSRIHNSFSSGSVLRV